MSVQKQIQAHFYGFTFLVHGQKIRQKNSQNALPSATYKYTFSYEKFVKPMQQSWT